MGAVAIGLLIAAAFGSGDFIGGRASQVAATVSVVVVAQACSASLAVVLVLAMPAHVSASVILLGLLAGAVNVIGMGLLYDGLARHPAVVVAPITAVVAAVVPVAWGLARVKVPTALAAVGIALAIGAGALIAVEGGVKGPVVYGAAQAVAAGIAFGSSLVLYSSMPSNSGQWPVLMSRVGALVAASLALVVARRSRLVLMPVDRARTYAIACGVLDVAATSLLVIAVRHNLLVIVAPVVALGPAFTVIWARVLGGQRLRPVQRLGLLVALAGLILIAA